MGNSALLGCGNTASGLCALLSLLAMLVFGGPNQNQPGARGPLSSMELADAETPRLLKSRRATKLKFSTNEVGCLAAGAELPTHCHARSLPSLRMASGDGRSGCGAKLTHFACILTTF